MSRLQFVLDFWKEDAGQDLIEYTLIIALFVFILFGLVGLLSPSINGMWANGNARLASANTSAS
jgi:Flp pilus assembly pilin Flp